MMPTLTSSKRAVPPAPSSRKWKRRLGPPGEPVPNEPAGDEPTLFQKMLKLFFVLFLMIIMVRVSGAEADSPEVRLARQAMIEGGGDALKQVTYAVSFIIVSGMWLWLRGLKVPSGVSAATMLLVVWIFLSLLWTVDPDVSLRRAVLLLFVMTCLIIPADLIGSKATEDVLAWLLAACLVISLVSIPLFSFARHPSTESDMAIAGAWRGIFQHKNVAGAVISISVIVFFNKFLDRPKPIYLLLAVMGVVFLIGGRSKTQFGLLPLALSFGLAHRHLWRSSAKRMIYVFLGLIIASIAVLATLFRYDRFYAVLNNPESFTGRAGIWRAVLDYVAVHPWLGAGYSVLWSSSVPAPILPYINRPYQAFMVHSHNGFLDLLGTIGLPGLAIAVAGAVIVPMYQLFSDKNPRNANTNSMLLSLLVFCIAENMMETQLYSRDKEVWTFYFLAITILQMRATERRHAAPASYRRAIGRDAATARA